MKQDRKECTYTMGKWIIIFQALILCTFQINAQEKITGKPRKWDVKISMGFPFDNPTKEDFTAAGQLPSSAVKSFHDNTPWNLEVNRKLPKNFTAGISVNRRGFEGTFFTQRQKFSSTGISPVFHYNLKDIFLIGAGPSVYLVIHKDYNPNSALAYRMATVGFELTSSLRFPRKSRFYVQAEATYCKAGKIEKFEFCDVTAGSGDDILFYYARNISMSYMYIGIGIGLRL